MIPVYLSAEEIKQFYEGFSNEILWPVFHYVSTYANYQMSYWEYYQSVNKRFCEVVATVLQPGDIVWVHDYQLLLLPTLLRKEQPDITLGFFQHIPFPSYELFRLLPWRSELLNGMLGADLLGFHTYDDAHHFLESVSRILQMSHSGSTIRCNDRSIVVESFPMGIDYDKFQQFVTDDSVQQNIAQLKQDFPGVRFILSIDRLDYSKGILQRLQAFELFLANNPEYLQQVSLYMIVVPSRDKVQQYRDLRDEIDKLVGNINARYRTNNWSPIHYFYRSFSILELSALFQFAEVCLVTPMRDGMNLVCKEYVASRSNNDGVLILSEMAGASKELTDALIVNPNNVMQMSEAIKVALTMPVEDQQRRMKAMRDIVRRYNINNWVQVFMGRLREVKDMQLSLQTKYIGQRTLEYIKAKYAKATRRLLLLDYDGTLVGFNTSPQKVAPDKELYDLLEHLIKDEKNHVIIISGRAHTSLDEWFGKMNIGLVGEHGVWHRQKGMPWSQQEGLSADWKQEILPVLQSYTDRTPGTFIEEKTYSLVWHYRRAEEELGDMRAGELMNTLRHAVADLGLSLLAGNKVVEIKNIEVNKGKTALHYTANGKYDFVLAIGDDTTDEDMFRALKDTNAFTIKVSSNLSAAKYYLKDPSEVRLFLHELANPKHTISKMFGMLRQTLAHPFQSIKKKI
jgi:trehalose 6-phosphate synthase/phosphatase